MDNSLTFNFVIDNIIEINCEDIQLQSLFYMENWN